MTRRPLLLPLFVASGLLVAQAPPTPPTDEEIREKLTHGKAYTLVFFKTGSATPPAAAELEKIQREHMRNLFTLKADGLATLAGPFTGPAKGDLRGLVIFNTTDEALVRARLDADPFVRAGLMIYELQPWYGLPGDGVR